MGTTNCPLDLVLKQQNCNQSELARRLGCSRETVSKWRIRGHISPRFVKRVSEMTGIPPHCLNPLFPVAQPPLPPMVVHINAAEYSLSWRLGNEF